VKNLNLTYLSQLNKIFVLGILIVLLIAGSAFIYFFLRRRRKKNILDLPAGVLYAYWWLTVFMLGGWILLPNFSDRILFENPTFLITPIRLVLLIYIVLTTLLVLRLLRWRLVVKLSKSRGKVFSLLSVLLWIVAIGLLLRVIAKSPDAIFGITILKFSKVKITIFDLFSILNIIIFTEIISITLRGVFDRLVVQNKLEQGTAVAIFKFLNYTLWVIAIAMGLEAIGFKLTILLASSAALLVGVGMGIQQLFNDVVSGFILLTENNVKVGDVVEVNDLVGKIEDIGFRTTLIKTRDNIRIIVPNSKLTSDNVINWTSNGRNTRFSVTIGVAYGSDVEKVMEILKKVAVENKHIRKKPEPFVRFEDFGDSALIFGLYFYTDEAFWVENIKSELRVQIDKLFRENNIEIPFPQQDVYLYVKEGKTKKFES